MTKQEITEELTRLKEQFDSALNKLDASDSQSEVKAVSKAYSELKTYVVEYSGRLEKLQRSGRLNELQSAILQPAINEIALHCSAPRNSTDKNKLSSSLYDCTDYLGYYLSQLNA